MKKTIIFLTLIQSSNVLACGGGGSNIMDTAVIASAVVIVLCSITLPVSSMLFSRVISVRNIILICCIPLIGIVVSIGLVTTGNTMNIRASAVFLAAISMFCPTAFYFYSAIKHHVNNEKIPNR